MATILQDLFNEKNSNEDMWNNYNKNHNLFFIILQQLTGFTS